MSRYSDMPVCDLRHLNDVNAIQQIEEICDIALLILPSDASEEVMGAIAAIPKSDIASTITLSKKDDVRVSNGIFEAADADFNQDAKTVVVVNGAVIIKNISKETKGSIIVNGIVVLHESLRTACSLSFPMVNGIRTYMDFDEYKFFNNEIDIDSDFISYMAPKTLILAGNTITIKSDVTIEVLKEKGIRFFAGNSINCYENIASYIRANAFVGNRVNVLNLESNG